MPRSEAQKRAQKKYQNEKNTIKGVKFIHSTDSDILEYIENIKPFSGYVKNLIRKDMKENQEKKE